MKYLIRILPLLIVTFFALVACGAKETEATEPPEASDANESGVMPTSLQTIEAAAEDIIDVAPSGNWDKISTDVTDIENAWNSYQPQADENGASQEIQDAMTAALAELQTASSAKDPATTMQASNNVSAAVVELFALYNPKTPVDIGRLDVLERQIILDVAAKDYSAAEASLTQVKSVWENVKPSVLDHNGKDVAEQFEASIATQESALSSRDDIGLINEAKNGLEIVDELEQLY